MSDAARPRRVVLGFGTRPEAIKLAPVYLALQKVAGIDPSILVTGQHQEQLDQALSVFGIGVSANLRVMVPRQHLPELTARIVPEAARYLREVGADYVLVQGDTLSTFAIAWAAFLERIRVGHVEAGLRSHRLDEPFPEEANRRLTSVLADLHFAPTPGARDNLLSENVEPERILVTGQTGVDALHFAIRSGRAPPGLPAGLCVTVTLHRRENWPRLASLARVVRQAAERHRDLAFVFPVHRNPVVREAVRPVLSGIDNITLMDPLEYGAMAALLSRSRLIVTDSGGLQEEGVTLGIPVILLRDVTERPEGRAAGMLRVIGVEPEAALAAIDEALNSGSPPPARPADNPYGDGQASDRVARGIAWRLGLGPRPADWQAPSATLS